MGMRLGIFGVVAVLAACGPAELVSVEGEDPAGSGSLALVRIPAKEQPATVDVGSWNVEWLGSTENGPADEALQQSNVVRVINELNLDLIGLVEVVSEDAFQAVLARLPGYEGLLVTDPRVAEGRTYYSSNEQKVALLFKRRFTVDSARVILTDKQWDFAGRPPLEVKLRFYEGAKLRTLVVVVAHFKAMANEDGYTRRLAAASALKQLLDSEYPTRWVLTIGDFNDDLDSSTYRGNPSPFAALVADPNYRFTTAALTAANVSTTTSFSSTIDHHLATDELAQRFVEGSAEVLRVDAYVSSYARTTSDHYPVLTRYDLR